MSYFSKGRHRRTRRSKSVYAVISDCRRIPISDLFAIIDAHWVKRGETRIQYAGQLAGIAVQAQLEALDGRA